MHCQITSLLPHVGGDLMHAPLAAEAICSLGILEPNMLSLISTWHSSS